MHSFLLQLAETGHVTVPPFETDRGQPVDGDAVAALHEIEARERLDFPGDAPALSLPAARWAAGTFYRACQLLVCRDVSAAVTAAALAVPCPVARSAETDYSVDLTFRHLPALLRMAWRVASADPLVASLLQLAHAWPLSSVGADGLEPSALAALDPILAHPGLRQLYVDRVLRHLDIARLHDPRVRDAVDSTLGLHAETLSPAFA